MKRLGTMTLGCKLNHTETQAIEGLFKTKGYQIVAFEEMAEVYLINTCSVTHLGERKSRQIIRRAIRNYPEAIIIVTGCYAQSAPGEISGIEGVDLVIGTQDRHHIVEWVENYQKGKEVEIHVGDILSAHEFEELPAYEEGRSRAFLKVQEGCNQYCTYCIIPYTRGPLRSRTLEAVERESDKLWKMGFLEIVLTGIHLGAYGLDLPNRPELVDLVKLILSTATTGRVRLGSLESVEVSPELIQLMKSDSRLCKQLHLPLQSGTDKILKAMGRPYTIEKFTILLEEIRRELPQVAITTDIIVGFPGETDEDFEQTLKAVESFEFSGIHVFPYSPRRGTPAAEYPAQVSEETKKHRVQKLQGLADQLAQNYRDQFIEKELEVLWEEPDSEGIISGWSSEYIRVYKEVVNEKYGNISKVVGTKRYKDGIWAK